MKILRCFTIRPLKPMPRSSTCFAEHLVVGTSTLDLTFIGFTFLWDIFISYPSYKPWMALYLVPFNGTSAFLCWCAVKKLHTHSLTSTAVLQTRLAPFYACFSRCCLVDGILFEMNFDVSVRMLHFSCFCGVISCKSYLSAHFTS